MSYEVIKMQMKYDKIHLDVLIVDVCLLSTPYLVIELIFFIFFLLKGFLGLEFMQSEV